MSKRPAFTAPGRFLAAVVAIGVALAGLRAEALEINVTGPGFLFNSSFAPPAAAPGVSQAQLMALVGAAGDYWESLIDSPTPRTVTIQVGFTLRLGPSVLAGTIGGFPQSTAAIGFSPNFNWFVDATPFDNSEYTTFSENFADFGGGLLNQTAIYGGATGNAAGRHDLFSVALHELGHALGLSNSFFLPPGSPLEIEAPLPFAGSKIPFRDGHPNINTDALMDCCIEVGVRSLPSDADILAVAQAGEFTEVNLRFVAVPEPATALLFSAALALLLHCRQRLGMRR